MSNKFCTFLIMGVAASGKTTIAEKLAEKINGFLIEGDDYHTKENIDKMSSGVALNDDDRYEWLLKIKKGILNRNKNQNLVVTCSALKEKYRALLGPQNFNLVYLKVSKKTALQRIRSRQGHFMPDSLVDSQFAILEEPQKSIVLNESLNTNEMIEKLVSIYKSAYQ
jgi:carbohydrate kinase (thermoresistant glucokinase family)